MATISEIRQQYPQYSDMSDVELADAFHSKFYSDIPIEPNLEIQWTRQNIIHREDAYWEQFKKMK